MPETQENDWLLDTLSSPINLFDNRRIFDEMVERSKRQGYEVHEFNCRNFKSKDDITNAILHSFGRLDPDEFRKNVEPIIFMSILGSPWLEDGSKTLVALRDFDAFHRLDPQCSQKLLRMLAHCNYQCLWRGKHYLVCAHYEDTSLQSEPTSVCKAKWNSMPCFSEAADIEKQKLTEARTWLQQVQLKLGPCPHGTDGGFPCVGTLLDMTGYVSLIEMWEAAIPIDTAVQLVLDQQQSQVWWREVIERFVSQSTSPIPLRSASVSLARKFDPTSRVALYRLGITFDEGLALLKEAVDEEPESPTRDWRYLDAGWRIEVLKLFHASSPIPRTEYKVVHALYSLASADGKFLSRHNATPEQAVEMLLNAEPEVWKL